MASVRKPIEEVRAREAGLRKLLKKPMQHLVKLQKVVDAAKEKAANIAAAVAKKKAEAAKLRDDVAAELAKKTSVAESEGGGGGDDSGIAVLDKALEIIEAENEADPLVLDLPDLAFDDDDDDDDEYDLVVTTSDEKKSAGRKIKIKTAIISSQGIYLRVV